jgi:DNA replication protein DnaC
MTEKKQRVIKNLRAGIEAQHPGDYEIKEAPCLMSVACMKCSSKGFIYQAIGTLARAVVCPNCLGKCEACHGTCLRVENGKAVPCKNPNPKHIINLVNTADIPARYATARLEGFTNRSGNGNRIFEELQAWLKDFKPVNYPGIVFGGNVGVGKTFLMVSLLKVLIAQGYSCRFIDFQQLLLELKAMYDRKSSEANILKELIDCDVLFLDELGKGRATEWELAIVDQIIMGRYNAQRVLVASTNYKLEEAPSRAFQSVTGDLTNQNRQPSAQGDIFLLEFLEHRIGSRVYSRLVETCKFKKIVGDNMREKLSPGILPRDS